MDDRVFTEVDLELRQIEQLFVSYSELLDKARKKEPDLVEMTAIASVLHSFYSALEKIFLTIARRVDQAAPDGYRWHRDLLDQMTIATKDRPAVLSKDLALHLTEYLGFRHFYRNAYSFVLVWDELQPLTDPLPDIWSATRQQIEQFVDALRRPNLPRIFDSD